MPPPQIPMTLTPGASLSDILTSAINLTQALNGVYNTLTNIYGAEYGIISTGQLSASTLIKPGRSRVAGISVVAGAAVSYLHDIGTAGGAGTGNRIYEISATHGFYPVSLIFDTGLVFAPGASVAATIFYTPG